MSTPFRLIALLLLASSSGSLCGCVWMRNHFGPRDPFVTRAPCALPQDATATEVVDYLNANTEKIPSWRSDNVKIRQRQAGKGVGMAADAMLAIEAPRNFRLVAKSPLAEEVDLGSNSEQFWYWVRQAEQKHVFVAYHDEESVEGKMIPIPFDPDWIMEAFGVMPIDAAQVTVEPGPPNSQSLKLISYRMGPDGEQVRKETIISTCHGIVQQHVLYDSRGQLIATATLSGHVRDRNTQAVVPTRVDLDWPKAKLGLTMELGTIEIKPQKMPESLWLVPAKKGYPVYNMNR